MAGLTVGLVVIPQGVAYAGLAGMPLVTGIYASLLPSLIGALFSASTRLSVGPTALTCLLISASIGGLAEPGGADWVNLAVWLALLSGLFQLVLGALRAGSLLNLVSAPVLMAFTQAAAVLIILSQLGDLVGWPSGNVQGVFSFFDGFEWPVISAAALCFGVGSLVVLLAFRRWQARFPAVLVVMLLAAGISAVVQFQASGGAVVGALPGGLPTFYWPHWPGLSTLQHLLVPALIVTLVSFLETAASARVDSERQGKPWGQNQDLIGQGLAKVASALSGSFATSSSFSRSALNLYAGAQT
ncbi:MAG: SulP family inorganic anion transporter, partial [Burkholderiaceae bacterium]|nr:SulP family inorganic anion transporter [Burkholderiaceae bacterium]